MTTMRQTVTHGAMLSLVAPAVMVAALVDPIAQQQPAAPGAAAAVAGAKLAVPFSDPSRPGLLRVSLTTGTIRVSAHQGKDVLIVSKGDERERDHERTDREGLRRIRNTSGGLVVEEERNEMRIGSSNPNRTIVLDIQVPTRTSLVLSTVNDGDIIVQGVEGDLEVNNTNGGVSLKDVSGSVVAHALNEDVTVTLTRVAGKPMSFTSLNGDINVTLPSTIKANVRLDPGNGEVYSDFDVEMLQPVVKQESAERRAGGKQVLRVDQTMTGRINGGGPEMTFKTFNGDIRIRKGA
jgi:hypothetical protein